jgi:hypothetical protein
MSNTISILNTAKINSLTQDIRQLRVRLDGISTEMDAFGSLVCKIEERLSVLEDAENYRQQDEDVDPASSLVKRVAVVIDNGTACDREHARIARDAIREVAAWMTSNPDHHFPPALVFALEQEAE